MYRETILLDIDETINNLNTKWLKIYNTKYNDNLLPSDITEWDISKFVKPEAKEDIYELLKTPGLFSDMVEPPVVSVEVTKLLSKFYDIYPLSYCKYPINCYEKVQYLEKYFPHINTDNFISCKNKSLIKGDYMIDDYHENFKGFNGNGVLINKSYNLSVDGLPKNIYRVDSWYNILTYFYCRSVDVRNYIMRDYDDFTLIYNLFYEIKKKNKQ
jgi:5'(3')-deoxyribonucleotidase